MEFLKSSNTDLVVGLTIPSQLQRGDLLSVAWGQAALPV